MPVKSTSELLLPKMADKFMILAILGPMILLPRNLTANHTVKVKYATQPGIHDGVGYLTLTV